MRIALYKETWELAAASRDELVKRMRRVEGLKQAVAAFEAADEDATFGLDRDERVALGALLEDWLLETTIDTLPEGIWDLRCAVLDDLYHRAD